MNAKVPPYICFIATMLFCASMLCAQTVQLHIKPIDKDEAFINNQLKLKTVFNTMQQCNEYVLQLTTQLQAKGYLSASIDKIVQDTNTMYIDLFIGDVYKWKKLYIVEEDKFLLSRAGIRADIFEESPYQQEQVTKLKEKLLDYLESNGYPFAKLKFDSIRINNGEVNARLEIDKGILYKMDSIHVVGDAKITQEFLYRYLSLPKGGFYSREKMDKINQRILELPYLQQTQAWDVSMLSNSYVLNLYLQTKKSNRADAIVGFLPANNQVGGKLLLTVDAKIDLRNAFATGETIALNWQQIQAKSPRLNLVFQRPYIFKSPFGLDFSFDLYKKDSAYLNINTNLGLQYAISGKQKGKIFFQFFNTNLLEVDTLAIINNKTLPDIIDVGIQNLGFEYELNNTNYRYNPTSGNEMVLTLTAGNKTIKKNNTITQIKGYDYGSLYDTFDLKTYQVKVQLRAAQYFPLGKFSVIKAGINAGLLQSPAYFRNEMFQLGGYKTLRGFDEETIFTNRYAIATAEFRYLIDRNSYFSIFSDGGFSHNSISNITNTYIGGGLGMAFETKQGIFNINYAVGKRDDLPFSLRQSKIHLGFIAVF